MPSEYEQYGWEHLSPLERAAEALKAAATVIQSYGDIEQAERFDKEAKLAKDAAEYEAEAEEDLY